MYINNNNEFKTTIISCNNDHKIYIIYNQTLCTNITIIHIYLNVT